MGQEIENFFEFCRNNGVKPSDGEELIPEFIKHGVIPVSRKSPEGHKDDVDDAIAWIRAGKPTDDELADEFRKVDSLLPTKKKQTPESRARDITNVLEWVRQNGISGVEEPDADKMESLPSLPVTRRTPEQRLNQQE